MQIRRIERMTVEAMQELAAQGDYFNISPTDQPSADQAEVITALMQPEFVGKCFPAWAYTITTSNNTAFDLVLTESIAISKSKKNGTISCKFFDLDNAVEEGSTCFMIQALGKFQQNNQLQYKDDSGKKIYKKIECVSGDENVLMDQETLNKKIADIYPKLKKITHCKARKSLSGIYGDNTSGVVLFPQRNIPGMDLFKQVMTSDLNVLDCLQIGVELFKALKHQFEIEKVIHRDIKPENIMVEREEDSWSVEIIDYDYSRDINEDDGLFPNTEKYAAPELIACQTYDESVDIYSAAKTLIFVCSFANVGDHDEFQKFLNDCLHNDRHQRPKIDECINRMEIMLHQHEINNSHVSALLTI